MDLFYSTDIRNLLIFLPEEEARHAVQVLRHQVGDAIGVIDGKGGFYEATIIEVGKKKCVARVEREQQQYQKRPFFLHIGIAPTKNIDRFEWFLEKATEIGIDAITPLLCEHSERRKLRNDRLEKILLAAAKQSQKAYLPLLNELTPLEKFLTDAAVTSQRFIAYLGEDVKGTLKENYRAGQSVTILIGPEGDFSGEEIRRALACGYQGVSLGNSRLRTETAGIVACHTINLLNS